MLAPNCALNQRIPSFCFFVAIVPLPVSVERSRAMSRQRYLQAEQQPPSSKTCLLPESFVRAAIAPVFAAGIRLPVRIVVLVRIPRAGEQLLLIGNSAPLHMNLIG